MKKVSLIITVFLAFSSCNSAKNDNKAAAIPYAGTFSAAASGEWVSQCVNQGNNAYVEHFVLQNGVGTSRFDYMQNQNCAGSIIRTDGPNNFTYVVTNVNGNVSNLTLTYQGVQQTTQITVMVTGDTMVITSAAGTINYYRALTAANPSTNRFDQLAIGSWVTGCHQGRHFSAVQTIVINGQGSGYSIDRTFAGLNCTGVFSETNRAIFNYNVQQLVNGRAQVMIGQTNWDILFYANQMTWNSGRSSVIYTRQ
ncbi:MAG: hypothetical protein H7328_09655 [Bdellovibrio sp.]|nr:hypothetical protein [Bdellovibrio sp.]